MFMSVCRIAMAMLLCLVGSCLSQQKGGVDQRAALPEVQRILSTGGRSGSLEYWGFCDPNKDWPDFPEPRSVSNRTGSALDLLQWMFADDPKMQVTQERDGKIRMVEADVPQDLLQVKIHHISFSMPYTNGKIAHSGPMAVYSLLNAPEVIAFMNQTIGRDVPWEGWGMPGQLTLEGPNVPELNDVTVEQALNEVLQTFRGFWIYQNCRDPQGRRKISVGFVINLSSANYAPIPKKMIVSPIRPVGETIPITLTGPPRPVLVSYQAQA
jgi:hypothetical protein